MSKHVGEKCEKWADGDRTDEESDGRTETRMETRTDITIPLYVPSEDRRIKSGENCIFHHFTFQKGHYSYKN